MAVLIVHVKVKPGAECAIIEHSMRVSPLTSGNPSSDLNQEIRTHCMRSLKCAEATWNYKSEGEVHYITKLLLFSLKNSVQKTLRGSAANIGSKISLLVYE